jgi:protein-S-isoprenylcysteine O-methyltransferase Ste14
MDIITRVILSMTLLVALSLGIRMATGKVRHSNLLATKGLTFERTLIVSMLGPFLALEIIYPRLLSEVAYLPLSVWINQLGALLVLVAVLIRIWSQMTLKSQWAADLSLDKEHSLITTGPYSLVRHPMYTSYLPAAIGFLLSTSNLLIGVLAILYLGVSLIRIPDEERFLLDAFGDKYRQYQRKTPRRVFPGF